MTTPNHNITSILFVCMGNICRSPAGENVMRRKLEEAGLATAIRCDSAGTHGYHIGAPPDSRMISAGRSRGLPMTGTGRKVSSNDIDEFDLILAMDNQNHSALMHLTNETNHHKVKRFCEFVTDLTHTEVPDPYYGDAHDFELVLDILNDGCAEIVRRISSGPAV